MEQKIYDTIYAFTRKVAGTFLAPVIDALIDFSIERTAERLSLVNFTNTAFKNQAISWADVLRRVTR